MTSHWEILDLEPTQDERLLRRAYAKQLKTIDQDLEPQRFIQLREALEHAQNDIRYGYYEDEAGEDDSNVLKEAHDSEQVHHETPSEAAVSIIHEHDIVQPVASDPPSDNHPTFISDSAYQHSRADLYAEARMLVDRIRIQDTQADLIGTLSRFLSHVEHSLFLLASEKAELRLSLDQAAASVGLDGVNDLIGFHALDASDFQRDAPLPEVETLESSSFLKKREVLYQSLWEDRLDDETFALFTEILTTLPLQTLGIQMQTHDQLAYNLAMARDPEGDVDRQATERFVYYWQQSQGNEVPLANAHPSLHALHERMLQLQAKAQFWQSVPSQYLSAMTHLYEGKGVHYWEMLKLAYSKDIFIKNYFAVGWQMFPIQNIDKNFNAHLLTDLRSVLSNVLNWLTACMVAIGSYLLIGIFFQLDFLIGLSIFIALIWFYFIQAPVYACVQVMSKVKKVTNYLVLFWLVSGLLLSVILVHSEPVVQEALLGLWLIVGALVDGVVKRGQTNLLFWLIKISRSASDSIFAIIGFALLIITIAQLAMWVGPLGGVVKSSAFLAFLPAVVIFYSNYFREIFKSIGRESCLWLCCISAFLLSFSFSGSNDDWINNVVERTGLFIFIFLSILVSAIPSRNLAYILKYGTYLSLIVLSVILTLYSRSTGVGAGVFILFFLYMINGAYERDKVAWAKEVS